MKYFIAISIALTVLSCGRRPKDEDQVRKTINKFFECSAKEDFECLYSLAHPRSFGGFTKKEIIADIKDGVHNERYDLTFVSASIDSVSKVVEYNHNKYALVKAKTDAFFTLKYSTGFNPGERIIDFCNYLSDLYGSAYVRCDSANDKIEVLSHQSSYVIYEAKEKKWYVLATHIAKNVARIVPRHVRDRLQNF